MHHVFLYRSESTVPVPHLKARGEEKDRDVASSTLTLQGRIKRCIKGQVNLPRVELEVRGELHHKLPRAIQKLQEDGAALILFARCPPRHSVRMSEVEGVPER